MRVVQIGNGVTRRYLVGSLVAGIAALCVSCSTTKLGVDATVTADKPNYSGIWKVRKTPSLPWNETYSISHDGPNLHMIITLDNTGNPSVLEFTGKIDGLEHSTTVRGYPARMIAWWQDKSLVVQTIRDETTPGAVNVKRVMMMSADARMITVYRTDSGSGGTSNSTQIWDRQ